MARNRCPGRYGKPPPGTTTRCEEVAATDPDASPVRESAAPEPKTATVERREASVLRGTQGASPGAWPAAECRPNGCLASTRTTLGAPPTPSWGCVKRKSKTRAQIAPRERERLFEK